MRDKRFEILEGLPSYGPMYVSINIDEEPFVSEGYVVRFYKSNGEDWVANFKPGWTDYSNIFDFPEQDYIIVIAGGLGYIMTPEDEKPKTTFGMTIKNVIPKGDGSLVCVDDTHILILDTKSGELWESERISWDGIKELELNNNILTGQSYDPTNSITPWANFTIHLNTKEIEGGSFQTFLTNNPHLESDKKGLIKEKPIERKKDWWKFWK